MKTQNAKKLALSKETLQRLKIRNTGIRTGLQAQCPTNTCTCEGEYCRNSWFSLCDLC